MAFRSSTEIQVDGLQSAKRTAASLKSLATSTRNACAAATQSANVVTQMFDALVQARTRFLAVAAIPGIAQYAKDQENDQAYDVVAEFNAMTAAVVTARDWIISNFPSNGAGGYILKDKLAASGTSVRTFTVAQLAGFVAALDALIATIS